MQLKGSCAQKWMSRFLAVTRQFSRNVFEALDAVYAACVVAGAQDTRSKAEKS